MIFDNWFLLVLISALFLTAQRIVQKKVLMKEHATEYLTTFCILMFIFQLPFISFLEKITRDVLFLIYIKSLLATVSWLLIVKAYRHMELSYVEPLKNLLPLFLIVLAYFFLNESIGMQHLVGVIFIIFGAYMLEIYSTHDFKSHFSMLKNKYFIYIAISMFLGAIGSIFDKTILTQTTSFNLLFYLFLFTGINMLVVQSIMYKGIYDVIDGVKKARYWIILIVIVTLLSDLTYFMAVKIPFTLLSIIVPLRRIHSLFVVIVAGEIFHEKKIIAKCIACLIMLLGTYFILI